MMITSTSRSHRYGAVARASYYRTWGLRSSLRDERWDPSPAELPRAVVIVTRSSSGCLAGALHDKRRGGDVRAGAWRPTLDKLRRDSRLILSPAVMGKRHEVAAGSINQKNRNINRPV
jgi:hypothetical protein